MADPKKELSQEGFSDAEADAIIRRALQLQARVKERREAMDQASLEAGAEAVGVERAFIRQAIEELRAEKARRAARTAAFRRLLGRAVAVVAALFVLTALYGHRVLSSRFAEVEIRKAQLENVIQRKRDLIPNLIAAAQLATAHEKALAATLEVLLKEMRQAKSVQEKAALEQRVDATVQELLQGVRSKADASSAEMFARLSDEMAGAENRIAVERQRYNQAAAAYMRAARAFPVSLVRPFLGFPARPPEP